MKASIIIPAYNEEANIVATLVALTKQSFKDFEIIVIDNNSTDLTVDMVNGFISKSKVEIGLTHHIKLVSETNKGTMWACEKGRRSSIGDIIIRVDGDCLPDPSWLESGMKFFDDPSVSALSGPYDYFDGPVVFRALSLYAQKYIYTITNYILRLLGRGGVMIGGNSFMRASALEAVGGFNTGLVFYGDDTDTAKRMATKGNVIFSPKIVMKTSARRFISEGIIKLSLKYFYYFFRTIIKH